MAVILTRILSFFFLVCRAIMEQSSGLTSFLGRLFNEEVLSLLHCYKKRYILNYNQKNRPIYVAQQRKPY